jgi:hypothetical protein
VCGERVDGFLSLSLSTSMVAITYLCVCRGDRGKGIVQFHHFFMMEIRLNPGALSRRRIRRGRELADETFLFFLHVVGCFISSRLTFCWNPLRTLSMGMASALLLGRPLTQSIPKFKFLIILGNSSFPSQDS